MVSSNTQKLDSPGFVRLLLLFKLVNNLLTIPTTYMPTLSPLTVTRAQCNLKYMQIQTSSRIYQCLFFPRTIYMTVDQFMYPWPGQFDTDRIRRNISHCASFGDWRLLDKTTTFNPSLITTYTHCVHVSQNA